MGFSGQRTSVRVMLGGVTLFACGRFAQSVRNRMTSETEPDWLARSGA